jgi:DNA-binding protein H-NS
MAYQTPEIAELLAKQDALNRQLAEAKERETRQVLIEIVEKMREYNIGLDELMGRKSRPQEPAKEPAKEVKYRDPVSGATWSGRGRAPQWIAGKDREEFLADRQNSAAASDKQSKTLSKAAVQAALFGD